MEEERKKVDLSGDAGKEGSVVSAEPKKNKIDLLEILLDVLKGRTENKRNTLVEAMA